MPKHQSLFQCVNHLRHYGSGEKVTRCIWDKYGKDIHWQLTRIHLKQGDSTHGRAYGIFYWNGQSDGKVREIRCPLKKQWRLIETGKPGLPSLQAEPAGESAPA